MKSIQIIAKSDCRDCHGIGYVEKEHPYYTGTERLPCDCILEQIPEDASMDIDYQIVPSSSLEPVILEKCAADHSRYKNMGITFCPECGVNII